MFYHKHLNSIHQQRFCSREQEEARAAEMLRAQEVGFGEDLPIFGGFLGRSE